MSAADKIRFKLQTATVVEKLIAVNVLAFLVFYLFRTIAYLFNIPSDFFTGMVSFSEGAAGIYYEAMVDHYLCIST